MYSQKFDDICMHFQVCIDLLADRAMELFREEKWEDAVREFSNRITEDPANPVGSQGIHTDDNIIEIFCSFKS